MNYWLYELGVLLLFLIVAVPKFFKKKAWIELADEQLRVRRILENNPALEKSKEMYAVNLFATIFFRIASIAVGCRIAYLLYKNLFAILGGITPILGQ